MFLKERRWGQHKMPRFLSYCFLYMKKLISCLYTLITLLLLSACGPGKDKVRIEGKFANINDAEFYAYSEDGTFDGIDTIKISDGKFTYERPLTAPTVLTLLYPNFTQTYIIAEPGHTIKIKGEASKIGEAEVTGTEQNEQLSDFRIKHVNDAPSNLRLAAAQFIREQPTTLAAVAVFRKYFANVQTPDATLALSLLDLLKKAQPRERAVNNLDTYFRPFFKNAEGQPLPTFKCQTLDGRTVTAETFKGKNLVIAFTATWQTDSRALLVSLKRKLATLGGKWQCMVVSLDMNREALRTSIQNDSITYPVVCDAQAFNSPLVQKFGIHYVPSLLLVNAQGRILQRDVTKVDEARWWCSNTLYLPHT